MTIFNEMLLWCCCSRTFEAGCLVRQVYHCPRFADFEGCWPHRRRLAMQVSAQQTTPAIHLKPCTPRQRRCARGPAHFALEPQLRGVDLPGTARWNPRDEAGESWPGDHSGIGRRRSKTDGDDSTAPDDIHSRVHGEGGGSSQASPPRVAETLTTIATATATALAELALPAPAASRCCSVTVRTCARAGAGRAACEGPFGCLRRVSRTQDRDPFAQANFCTLQAASLEDPIEPLPLS